MSDNLSLTWNLNDEVLGDRNDVFRMITRDNQEKPKVKSKKKHSQTKKKEKRAKQWKLMKEKADKRMRREKAKKAAADFKKSTAGTGSNNDYERTKEQMEQRKVKVLQDNKKIFCQVCNVETNGNKNHERGIGSSILVVNRRQWVRKDPGAA